MKNWTLGRWKKEALKVIQKWARLRDSDDRGYCKCCSCGEVGRWDEGDGGHFIPVKNHLSTAFDERNIHYQCKGCNHKLWGTGRWVEYTKFMVDRYGQEVVDELIKKSSEYCKMRFYDYQQIIEKYTDESIGLAKKKGL